MNTTRNSENTNARKMFRRLAAGAMLAVAPMVIALGAATVSHADTGASGSDNSSVSTPGPQHRGPLRNQDIQRSHLPYTSISRHNRRHYQY